MVGIGEYILPFQQMNHYERCSKIVSLMIEMRALCIPADDFSEVIEHFNKAFFELMRVAVLPVVDD